MFLQDLQKLLSVHRIYPKFAETIEPKVLSKEVKDSLAESRREVRTKVIDGFYGKQDWKTEELTEGCISVALELILGGHLICVPNPSWPTALL